MNMTLTKEQYDEAHGVYIRDCKTCVWDTAADGMPVIMHSMHCTNVVPHVRNAQSLLKGTPVDLRGAPLDADDDVGSVPLEAVFGPVVMPKVKEAVAVLRPTTATAEAAEELGRLAEDMKTGPHHESVKLPSYAKEQVKYIEAKQPTTPISSEVPMTPGGLVEFFEFIHRSNVRIMAAKNADYANATDAFFNLRRGGQYGIIIRMDDKVSRLLNLLKEGAAGPKVDESIDDTLRDLGIYSTLCLAMRHEARRRKES